MIPGWALAGLWGLRSGSVGFLSGAAAYSLANWRLSHHGAEASRSWLLSR